MILCPPGGRAELSKSAPETITESRLSPGNLGQFGVKPPASLSTRREHLKKWRRIWDSNSRYRFYPYKGLKMRPPHGSPENAGNLRLRGAREGPKLAGRNTLQFTGFAASPMAHWMLPGTHSLGALIAPRTMTPGDLQPVSARVSRSKENDGRRTSY